MEQQDIEIFHKYRQGYQKERNQIANRIRGVVREYAVHFSLGIKTLRQQVPNALGNYNAPPAQ